MPEYSNLEKVRLEKIEALQAQGINPYPRRVERTHTNLEAIQAFEEIEGDDNAEPILATLVGRVRSMRPMGKITFAHIEDGTSRVQLFFRANDIGIKQVKFFDNKFDLGDFIQASGKMFRTRTGEVTLWVSSYRMLSKAVTPLPAAKDEVVDGEVVQHATLADPETRYRQRYADLAVNADVREVFRVRSKTIRALQDFLDGQGFLEVETPILQPIYGGAAAQPFVTHHNQLEQDLYLRISFELYLKRLLVGGFERVYEIGRDFRNEGVSFKHNPEFTQIEFYMAYADYEDVMDLTEAMLAHVVETIMCERVLTYQGEKINFEIPWKRVELRQGLIDAIGIDITEHPTSESLVEAMDGLEMEFNPNASRGKLIDDLLGHYLEPNFIQPTFLYDYPRDISPLAKTKPSDEKTVERFEFFIGGMEMGNAFTELNDPIDQEERFLEMGRAYDSADDEYHPIDEDYLRAMRYGMPPNGGFGMGVDRLVMLLTDKRTIREVLLFPPLRER
ncbi:MAG: Lysine--tRNA ligase [Chloroflexi bacterium]|nr:Lysine--tRNA ligase [Chloroflexota bacterium]